MMADMWFYRFQGAAFGVWIGALVIAIACAS